MKEKFDYPLNDVITEDLDNIDRKSINTILSVITNFQNLAKFGY